jgi:hypothetical protein
MNKRFDVVVWYTLLPILLTSINSIARATTVAPSAVLINSSNHLIVEKSAVWSAKEAPDKVAFLRRKISGNQYRLPATDDRKVRNCFRSIDCKSKLELSAVELRRTQPAVSDSGLGPVVSRLSNDIMVAYWPANPNQIIPVDMSTRGMVDVVDKGEAVAIDVNKRAIVVATCGSGDYKCEVRLQPFESNSSRLLSRVDFRIVDMTVEDGVVFAVAKIPGSKKLLGSGVLEAAGHGLYFENWFVLEISLETGEVKSSAIARNLKNASGFFPSKWDLR